MSLKPRTETTPWRDWGQLIIMAGNANWPEIGIRPALAAARTGVDLIIVAGPQGVAESVRHHTTDCTAVALPGKFFKSSHISYVRQHKQFPILFGCGTDETTEVKGFFKQFLAAHQGPLVLDGNALRMLSKLTPKPAVFKNRPVIFTPNREELALLAPSTSDREVAAKLVAKRWGVVVVTKGKEDVITNGSRVVRVRGGSPLLGKGGMGDIYAGIVIAVLSRIPNDPLKAATVASRLMKRAGAAAVKAHGQGVLPSDIPDLIDLRRVSLR